MIKDDTQNPADDPEAELRKRLAAQYAPDPTADPGDTGTPSLKVGAPDPAPFVPGPQITPPGPQTITPQGRGGDEPPPPPPPPPPTPPPSSTPPPPPTPPPAPGPSSQPTTQATPPPDMTGLRLGPNANFIGGIFKQQGKTATQNDYDYWENVITRAGGDLGYVRMRMLQPDTGGQPGAAGPAGMNYQQALAYVQGKVGRALSPAEIQAAFQRFGGTQNDTFTSQGLDPVVAYFQGQGGTGGPGGPGNQGTDTSHPTGNLGGDTRTRLIDQGTNMLPGPTSGPTALWGPEFMAQVRAQLMQRLQSASGPVDENDPTIRANMTAAQDAASRQTEKERSQLAEHLYASGGLNTDAITQGIQQSGERNAVGLGSLRANLMQREVEGRRSELQNLLQLALQSGDAEMTNAIRLQLAALDAQLRREGYGVDLAKYQAYLNQLSGTQLTGA